MPSSDHATSLLKDLLRINHDCVTGNTIQENKVISIIRTMMTGRQIWNLQILSKPKISGCYCTVRRIDVSYLIVRTVLIHQDVHTKPQRLFVSSSH